MTLNTEWPLLFTCGAAGAFCKDVLKDNKIKLPEFKNGYLYLDTQKTQTQNQG